MDIIMTERRRSRLLSASLIAPGLLILAALVAGPLIIAFDLSLRDLPFAKILDRGGLSEWTLSSYRALLGDSQTWSSIANTLVYLLASTTAALIIGFGIALLLNRDIRGRRLARILVLLPWPIPASVAGLIWVWILNTNYGIANKALLWTGLVDGPVPWLTSPGWAMISVIIVTIWKAFPLYTLMILAALQSVPTELYEAARLDGAGPIQEIRHVTIPIIRPVLVLAVLMQSLWALGQVDIIKVMTNGGPYRQTETLAMNVYQRAFQDFQISVAAASGVLLLLISAVMVAVALPRISRQ